MGTCGGRRTRSAKDWRVYYRLKQREWRAAHPPLPRPRARRRRKQKLPAPTVRLDFNHLADAMRGEQNPKRLQQRWRTSRAFHYVQQCY
jgi:hypothetical protein